GTPAALEEARRYARAEARASGRWGDWAWNRLESVAEVLLGDRQSETLLLAPDGEHALDDLLTMEMRAWLNLKLDRKGEAAAQRSREAFAQSGYAWAAREIEAAIAILTSSASGAPFASTLAAALASQAQWRRALAAIAALSDAERSAAPETRLAWMIKTELSHGRIAVEPWEQKRGPRGWSKGKQAALSRLAKSDRLAARDAQVCRALRRLSGNFYEIDIDRALPALVGHPLVFFDDDFATPVELVAAEPQLAIRRTKNGVRVTVPQDLRETLVHRKQAEYLYESRAEKKTDPCVLVRETATRARVIRVTAAHRRVAELIGAGLEVPAEGADELNHAVESLTSFFAVHSDIEAGVPEIAGDPMIRAELAPAGEGLRLRLAVRPFGEQGPRHAPGEGGARLIAEVAGERRAAARDLVDERRRADDVLEALPMLGDDSGAFEWRIDDPEDCLALVEALQSLGDTLRVEWPAGAKFHVTRPYGAADLKLAIRASRDWFVASGGLQLDDGMVLDMARLIEFARKSRGRYLPLGEGGFVALTEELKRRIEELAGTGEVAEQGLRVHPLAAQAINEIAAGATIESDGEWCVRLDRIRESETLEPEVPSTLQAELRPYQYEGYRWLARLAHWGAGACLADDMGLGKTVQALACLLKRAPEGAALVIAPTSVCQNWIDEARRFTPTLRCHLFGAGDRQRLVAEA
ncbi:MAG TPA: DEAD/DEAH box helicase, partial [Burkholderiales bacterium]|nr:DEAD/DEAH box helicase [Burkholderiales bacterium]